MKSQLADAAYAAGWGAVRHMPEPVARGAFQAIADVASRRGGTSVDRLRTNLARVLPDASDVELAEYDP